MHTRTGFQTAIGPRNQQALHPAAVLHHGRLKPERVNTQENHDQEPLSTLLQTPVLRMRHSRYHRRSEATRPRIPQGVVTRPRGRHLHHHLLVTGGRAAPSQTGGRVQNVSLIGLDLTSSPA